MCKEQQTLSIANMLDTYYNNVHIDSVDAVEGRIYFAADDVEEMQAVIEDDSVVFYALHDEDWIYVDNANLKEEL